VRPGRFGVLALLVGAVVVARGRRAEVAQLCAEIGASRAELAGVGAEGACLLAEPVGAGRWRGKVSHRQNVERACVGYVGSGGGCPSGRRPTSELETRSAALCVRSMQFFGGSFELLCDIVALAESRV